MHFSMRARITLSRKRYL